MSSPVSGGLPIERAWIAHGGNSACFSDIEPSLNRTATRFHTRSNSALPPPRCGERHRWDRPSLTRLHSKCSISSWKAPRAYTKGRALSGRQDERQNSRSSEFAGQNGQERAVLVQASQVCRTWQEQQQAG